MRASGRHFPLWPHLQWDRAEGGLGLCKVSTAKPGQLEWPPPLGLVLAGALQEAALALARHLQDGSQSH